VIFLSCPLNSTAKAPIHRFEISLADQITVSQLAQPDPDAAFDLNIRSGTFTEANLTLAFGDANILTGSQGAITDHKVDFFVSILKTVAGAVSHIIPFALTAAPPPPLRTGTTVRSKTEEAAGNCVNQL